MQLILYANLSAQVSARSIGYVVLSIVSAVWLTVIVAWFIAFVGVSNGFAVLSGGFVLRFDAIGFTFTVIALNKTAIVALSADKWEQLQLN